MSGIEFDFSEVNVLAADIAGAGVRAAENAVKAVERSAFLGKKLWKASADSHINHGSLKRYGASIDYDKVQVSPAGDISTEIGPNLAKGQGPLGIVEKTPGGVAGKPQRNREKIEQPLTEDFVRGVLAAVGDDGLGGA